MPVGRSVSIREVLIDDPTADDGTEVCTESVGHHDEKSLCAGTHARVRRCFDVHRSGDQEEIEGHSVNDAGQYDEYATHWHHAEGEKSVTQDPRKKSEKHHVFHPEALQEERNS